MKRRTKKTAAVVLSVILLLVLTFAVLPFFFKDKVMDIARRELNKRLTAEVDFKDLKISFIRNFPDASVSLKDLYIVGKDDFEGDTLLMSKDVNLVINLKSLFGDTGYEVKRMQINDSKVLAHVLKDGRANWEIFPEDTANVDTTESGFKFKLQDFNIARADVVYLSDSGNVAARMKNLNLNLNGDLTADSTLLSTNFTIDTLNFWNGGVHYASNLVVEFTADINAILSEDRYEFANNEMKINAIPLSLNGWVQMPDDEIEMDLTLNTEQVDFKSLLSLIPAIYTNSFAGVKADGKVTVSGFAKGKYEGESYPAFDLQLGVENGKFQYPDLPKSVDNIQIAGHITNPGGSLDNTTVDLSKLNFRMGGNPFTSQLRIVNPVSDPDFNVKAQGKMNLALIKDVYPLEKGTELNALLDMDVNAAG